MTVVLTRDQVRRLDELAVERYGLSGLVLMENAGRNAADIIRRRYGSHAKAFIGCGVGNNGGDGCVIARHLHNAGWSVRLLLAGDTARASRETAANVHVVRKMGLDVTEAADLDSQRDALRSIEPEDVIIDALLGTGFHGRVRSPTAELIDSINAVHATGHHPIVAIDVPSGLDCDRGTPSNATVRAELTITFVALKPGFLAASAAPYIGRVEIADIGAPRALIDEVRAADC